MDQQFSSLSLNPLAQQQCQFKCISFLQFECRIVWSVPQVFLHPLKPHHLPHTVAGKSLFPRCLHRKYPSRHWAVHDCCFGIISPISSENAVTFVNNTCILCSVVKMRGQLSVADKEKGICSSMTSKYRGSVTTCLLPPNADCLVAL